ncbi:tRNA nucleotidyltransferase [Luminiphilus sp.]|nr:tRNA nucleotidyltransferase [Luminiphilus sp.]
MKIYRVGGAVRDELLGYPHSETDWVVVGGTPQALLDQGFKQVGRDFPVFLHPQTQEEYALARTERKSGYGYHGFEVHAAPSVTLEEDLARRDLTINAIAMADDGTVIDPYGGRQDLEAKCLRHVSPHFVEDPLRVLRVARFAARYHALGFNIADETLALMRAIVAQGELEHLATERIWVETERALGEQHPEIYFQVLQQCNALAELMPAVAVTSGIDRLCRAARFTTRTDCRWAILLSELPPEQARATSETRKAPNHFRDLADRLTRWRPKTKQALRAPGDCMAMLEGLDALRRPEPFDGFCEAAAALESDTPTQHPSCIALQHAKTAANAVRAQSLLATGLTGPALGEALREARIKAIATVLTKDFSNDPS